jgi:flavin reductase (DIM6/NTAB) family NADH-FMN oxidoreductase RutF
VTIHNEHPFLPPESDRGPVRRFRGRLASPVTLWTASQRGKRAGLTVSSLMVVDGEPGFVVGMIDPLSDLWDRLRGSGSAVVNVLGWQHRQLADQFGYVAPAPGGPFSNEQWQDTEWGPALVGAPAWAGCRLAPDAPVELGWGVQVRLQIAHTEIAEDTQPLVHRRGRYHTF